MVSGVKRGQVHVLHKSLWTPRMVSIRDNREILEFEVGSYSAIGTSAMQPLARYTYQDIIPGIFLLAGRENVIEMQVIDENGQSKVLAWNFDSGDSMREWIDFLAFHF